MTRGGRVPGCGEVERLAERAENRFVCRCTCGALHLAWENATVQLRPHDLRTLVLTLEVGHLGGGHVAPFRIVRDGEAAQVWLYSTGLRLDKEGLTTFTDLVHEAEAQVWALQRATPGTRPRHAN